MKRRFASRKYKPYKFASRRFAGFQIILGTDIYHVHYFILQGQDKSYNFQFNGPSIHDFEQSIKDLITCQVKYT